jgi:hypothetical protein
MFGKAKHHHNIFIRKPEGKRPLEGPWHMWEVIMIQRMGFYHKELGCEDVCYIQLSEDKDAMVGCCVHVMNLSGSIQLRGFIMAH